MEIHSLTRLLFLIDTLFHFEYIYENWGRLVGTAQNLDELKAGAV
ncbi:MAG TPA: hypothetical protein VMM76_22530 [Pirellulaceae bacterium]|nr:hypothetical protein [Pirellulaceae bacterium]